MADLVRSARLQRNARLFLMAVELLCGYISNDETSAKLSRGDKSISNLESRRKKLTDMLLDDKITKDAYDEKYNDFTRRINQDKEERSLYSSNVNVQKDVGKRMNDIRTRLTELGGI